MYLFNSRTRRGDNNSTFEPRSRWMGDPSVDLGRLTQKLEVGMDESHQFSWQGPQKAPGLEELCLRNS